MFWCKLLDDYALQNLRFAFYSIIPLTFTKQTITWQYSTEIFWAFLSKFRLPHYPSILTYIKSSPFLRASVQTIHTRPLTVTYPLILLFHLIINFMQSGMIYLHCRLETSFVSLINSTSRSGLTLTHASWLYTLITHTVYKTYVKQYF